MMDILVKDDIGKGIIWAILISLMSMTFIACKSREKIFTIGIVCSVSIHETVIEGFKSGMYDLNYIEGKNVKYIYDGVIKNDAMVIDNEINNLASKDIDLLLTLGNDATLEAKKVVDGTNIPVLFSGCINIVDAGIVKDMAMPGGNITGVAAVDSTPKALEWLVTITPGAKKIYLPYNPDDNVSTINLPNVEKAAEKMGLELILKKVYSVEETVSDIENLPVDVDAILRIPSPTLDPGESEISRAAINRGLPLVARVNWGDDILLGLGTDLSIMGRQTARLAHEINQGVSPKDLPIEVSDPVLTINLRTAEKIGLKIPDNILTQAKRIIY